MSTSAFSLAELVDLCSIQLTIESPGDPDQYLSSNEQAGPIEIGYLNPIHPHPIQIIGHNELAYLQKQTKQELDATLKNLLAPKHTLAIVLADGIRPLEAIVRAAESTNTVILSSPEPAQSIIRALHRTMDEKFTPNTLLHGVMMAVYGLGVLITGRSGIGKSELGLELLSRNHRLIADDSVNIRRQTSDELIARCPERLQGHLEVRGLGILNIPEMFGYASVLTERPLQLIVHLQRTQGNDEPLDRLQINRERQEILGVNVPKVSLKIAPGRNLAVLVEAAARDNILRMRGRNASARFVDAQFNAIQKNEK